MGVIGGIVGQVANNGDEDKQAAAQQAALDAINGVKVPTIDEQKIALQKLQSAGELTPEMLDAITEGNTQLAGISTDPRLAQAQMNALMSLSKQGETGLSASDMVALKQTRRDTDRDVQARNSSVLQNMAQRGMGGSGAELAAQLLNSQEGADRASQESDRLAAMAQQNALNATAQMGNAATNMRSQEYGEKSAAAQAQDAINRFNAQNQQNVAATNVGTKNQAQASNLANKQNILNQNVGLTNQQEMYNKGLAQTNFANQMQKAGGVAGQQQNMANYYGNQADKTAAFYSGIGQGLDKGAGTILGYAMGNPAAGAGAAAPSGSPSVGNYGQGSSSSPQSFFGVGNGYAHGGEVKSDIPLMKYIHGGKVPGEPIYQEDDPRNDIVEARLSPGEIVVPHSIAHSSDEAILDFIKHVKNASKRGK